MKVETAGAWSQSKSTLTLGATTLASSAVAFRADGVRVVLGNEPSLVGTIDFRGDLAFTASPPADVVVATSSILVRERVVTVHVVSVLQRDEDRTWVIEATMRWIERIDSANQ